MNHYPDLAKEKECTACFACIDVCTQKALSSYINDEGHYAIKMEKEKCIKCGRCEKVCIESRNDYGNNNLTLSTIYAGYTTDEELRRAATSGGVFAAVAKNIVQRGGAVIGAYFDGSYAKHVLIDDVSELSKLQGSKYTPSSMEGIYRIIQAEIKKRIVLFSGTGCQVGAVLSYFSNNPYKTNLFTMDLVCGGVPSTALIKLFNDHYQNQYSILTFRNKDKYELTVRDQNNEIKAMSPKALPLGGFSCELTNRYACYDCKFAFCHRKSDLTIGDVWNYNILPQEHSKGLSLIISNTQKGEQLLKQSELTTNKIDWADVLKTNYRIAYGKGRIFSPRKRLQYNLSHLPYEKIEQIYCLSVKPYNIRLFSFKVYRHIMYKIEQRKRQKHLDELLSEYL